MKNPKPSIQEMFTQNPSKYALVVAAAKRGRAILEGDPPLLEVHAAKPVTIALEEIRQNMVTLELPPTGIK